MNEGPDPDVVGGADESDAETVAAATPDPATRQIASGDSDVATDTGALAWSHEQVTDDLVPYTDAGPYGSAIDASAEDSARWWQRLPLLAFIVSAVAALAAVGSAAVVLTSAPHFGTAAPTTRPSASPPVSPRPPAPPAIAAPSVATPAPAPHSTVTITRPTVTMTPSRPPAPAPRPPASTVAPATTAAPPPATPSASAPPETASPAPSPPPTPPMRTAYLRVPFVPVPIPIQVPANPNRPQYPYQQEPPYPY